MPLPSYIKLGLFAVRLSSSKDSDDEDKSNSNHHLSLPRIYFRTAYLRRYFHEENDPYAPYACEKYSDYRAHKQRWEERQGEMRERERARAERRQERVRGRIVRDGRLIEAERREAPETERAVVVAEGRRGERCRVRRSNIKGL